ncbi:MAG TPA: hypothetical protein VG938_20030 [Verrucomicrobiae bacterium]|nr:hypothetical protein [Verrucomicrobiae bacterium]
MKKLSLAVLLGIALSAMLTGCNHDDSSTPPASSTAPASTNASGTNAP